ncbi:hypothetical protein GCM10011403_30060 [Pseudohongiella nitratireducens]|uniref:Uncharacterized protein n=1 Tax=Pseudohongiella nitratireducens TaxID=1768907 RepID=A0A916VJW4_9GAMM|nr:hypothetical protein [Pseudohongiella nitratireducens]GFZ84550.1 hypothetical protein GCM10011403_30060 [Pseudohongiella nitratireducens]
MKHLSQVRLCRAIILLAFQAILGLPLIADAAEQRIRADVITDIAYISPGETQTLQVRVNNPEDSGVVIANASFLPQRYEVELLNRYSFLEIIEANGCPLLDNNASYGLKRACDTKRNDVFPINPGDSVTMTYRYLDIAESATPGTILLMSNITLRMYDTDDRLLPELYLDRDLIRIVADPDNPQVLPSLNTINPMAGIVRAEMDLFIDYPEIVQVGDTFELNARVVNHTDQEYTLSKSLSGTSFGAAYNVRGCSIPQVCQKRQLKIGANESVEGLTFPVRYRALVYKQNIWEVPRPTLRITDSIGRVGYIYADPIRVAVEHDTYLPTLEVR